MDKYGGADGPGQEGKGYDSSLSSVIQLTLINLPCLRVVFLAWGAWAAKRVEKLDKVCRVYPCLIRKH